MSGNIRRLVLSGAALLLAGGLFVVLSRESAPEPLAAERSGAADQEDCEDWDEFDGPGDGPGAPDSVSEDPYFAAESVEQAVERIEKEPAYHMRSFSYRFLVARYLRTNRMDDFWLLLSEYMPPGQAYRQAASDYFEALAKEGRWDLVERGIADLPYVHELRQAVEGALTGIRNGEPAARPTLERWREIVELAEARCDAAGFPIQLKHHALRDDVTALFSQ